MSTDSVPPVIVVERQELSLDLRSSDDVFVNQNAIDDYLSKTARTPQLTISGENSESFNKLVTTVKFVRKWANRADSAIPQELLKLEPISSTRTSKPNLPTPEPPVGLGERWMKEIKSRLLWNPTGRFLYILLGVVSLAIIYNSVIIIARETFSGFHDILLPLWLVLDFTADIIYIIDMVVHATTCYLHQGLVVCNIKQLTIHYIKTWYFKLDVVSILPTDLLYVIIGPGFTIVRVNRLLRAHRVYAFSTIIESRTNYPNLIRVLQLVLLISLIIHWNACFYFLISEAIGFGSDSWVYPSLVDEFGNQTVYASLTRQYLFSFYWSTLTLTTIGELPGPVQDVEYAFVIFDFLVGLLIFATIVGMVGGIITNMSKRRADFQENLDNLKQFMGYRRVGNDLQDRVIKWFEYQWTNNHTLNEEKVLQSLPSMLQAEIAIHVHFETLKQVKIFEQCEAGLLEELVLKLKPQVFSPGDYVCRKGDVGREMYIIKHGRLEVVGDDETTVYATLTDGGYFGEISILNLGGNGNRRTANVRSVGYSDLFCLSKTDLLETLGEYPETKALLEETGHKTLMKDGNFESEAQPKRIEPSSQERKIEMLENNLEQLNVRLSRLLGQSGGHQMKLKHRRHTLETRSSSSTDSGLN